MLSRAHRISSLLAALTALSLAACGGGGGGAGPTAGVDTTLAAGGGTGGGGDGAGGAGTGDGSGAGTGDGSGAGAGGGTGEGSGAGDGAGAGGGSTTTAPTLVSIVLDPTDDGVPEQRPLLVAGGAAIPFKAYGIFSDDPDLLVDLSTTDAQVDWSSTRDDLVTADAGLVTAALPGPSELTEVTVSASVGSVTGSARIVVSPPIPPTLSYLSLAKGSIVGGNAVTATVALTGPAPAGGIDVTLTSDNLALATIDDGTGAGVLSVTVTIPQGDSSALFTVATQDVTRNQKVRLTAEAGEEVRVASLNVRK